MQPIHQQQFQRQLKLVKRILKKIFYARTSIFLFLDLQWTNLKTFQNTSNIWKKMGPITQELLK